MDIEEKAFEKYHAAADTGSTVANNLDNLRMMLTGLYTSGAGQGLLTWREEDRELFLDMLLDAGEGRPFIPVPSPWPTHRNDDAEIAEHLAKFAHQYKDRPEIADALLAIAKDLKNGV